jgi:glycosyltransferase involved in cell wall biosynthesis
VSVFKKIELSYSFQEAALTTDLLWSFNSLNLFWIYAALLIFDTIKIMRIIIDLQSCQSGSRFGGVGRYSMDLTRAIAKNIGSHDLHILLSDIVDDGISEVFSSLRGLVDKKNFHFFKSTGPVADAFPENNFRARTAELMREKYITLLKPDIVHISSLFEGLGEDITTSVGRYFHGDQTSVTLYDLIPLVHSDIYLTNDLIKKHYFRKIEDLKKSSLLLSISDYSKVEAIRALNIPEEKIINISSATDDKFRPYKVPLHIKNKIKKKYGIKNEYIMYISSFDQRKNQKGLILAFGAIPYEKRKKFQLLIVGNGWEGAYQSLYDVGRTVGVGAEEIIFTGKIPDDDLLPLYNLCYLFVFPSFYEGFGLPVLEAMSCGTPVIASNCTSMPEVLGIREALFNPHDIHDISKKIYKVITNEGFRNNLIEKGLRHSKNFSWDRSSKIALSAFENNYDKSQYSKIYNNIFYKNPSLIDSISILKNRESVTNNDLLKISKNVEQLEAAEVKFSSNFGMRSDKVGLISTWNTRCGIAMYSKYVTSEWKTNFIVLAPFASIQVSADEAYVSRCWTLGEDDLDKLFFTIIENNIWNILIQFNYGFFNFAKLKIFIRKLLSFERNVSITLHCTEDPPNDSEKKLSILKDALFLCDHVFVQTKQDILNLDKLGLSDNVNLFPIGYYEAKDDPLNFRCSPEEFVIGSYGFFLPNKGFIELIEAIAILRIKKFPVKLLMLNSLYDDPASVALVKLAKEKIASLGLDSAISLITDFLSEDLSIRMMRNLDLIIFPYQVTDQPTSAAVRFGISSGVPIAVTPLPIFDDVSDIVFQLPGIRPLDLANGIQKTFSLLTKQNIKTKSKIERSKFLRESRSFSVMSNHLKKYLIGSKFYDCSSELLQTLVGYKDGNNIKTTGKTGLLMFGPHLSIDKGTYRITLTGRLFEGDAKKVIVQLVNMGGQNILDQMKFEIDSNGIVNCSKQVVFDDYCADLEICIFVQASHNLYINSLRIDAILTSIV